jgi:hypothetical protein
MFIIITTDIIIIIIIISSSSSSSSSKNFFEAVPLFRQFVVSLSSADVRVSSHDKVLCGICGGQSWIET